MVIFFGVMIVVYFVVWMLYVVVFFVVMIVGFDVIGEVIVFILVYIVKLLVCYNFIVYVFLYKRLCWCMIVIVWRFKDLFISSFWNEMCLGDIFNFKKLFYKRIDGDKIENMNNNFS